MYRKVYLTRWYEHMGISIYLNMDMIISYWLFYIWYTTLNEMESINMQRDNVNITISFIRVVLTYCSVSSSVSSTMRIYNVCRALVSCLVCLVALSMIKYFEGLSWFFFFIVVYINIPIILSNNVNLLISLKCWAKSTKMGGWITYKIFFASCNQIVMTQHSLYGRLY